MNVRQKKPRLPKLTPWPALGSKPSRKITGQAAPKIGLRKIVTKRISSGAYKARG